MRVGALSAPRRPASGPGAPRAALSGANRTRGGDCTLGRAWAGAGKGRNPTTFSRGMDASDSGSEYDYVYEEGEEEDEEDEYDLVAGSGGEGDDGAATGACCGWRVRVRGR